MLVLGLRCVDGNMVHHVVKRWNVTSAPTYLCTVPQAFRSVLFSLLIGFHNAWEQDDLAFDEPSARYRVIHRMPVDPALQRPARCFFWGISSLLN